MLIESSNNKNENKYSKNTNVIKEKMICKDGFCSLPNQEEISRHDKNDMNLFDPIK